MLCNVNLAIFGPEIFLGEHTVFYNWFTDLNCRELHRCFENVTPSHHSSSELNFRDALYFFNKNLSQNT